MKRIIIFDIIVVVVVLPRKQGNGIRGTKNSLVIKLIMKYFLQVINTFGEFSINY